MSLGTKHLQRGAGLLLLLVVFGTAAGFIAIRIFSRVSQQATLASTTSVALSQAMDALIGYAASHTNAGNPYLPCPDRTTGAGANDGAEDRVGGAGTNCVVLEGNLPWVTLGLTGLDGWNNRIRYRISQQAFATGFNTSTAGALTINNAAGTNLATGIPVVLVSHGPNGWGAISSGGVAIGNPPAANVNETENTGVAANAIYVSNPPVAVGGVGGEFDDVTVWLTTSVLCKRMELAGHFSLGTCP